MKKITITEALAEIHLINKKIEKKKENIKRNLLTVSNIEDPFKNDGGAKEYIKREKQGIEDLYKALVKIRSEISKANLENSITIGDETKTIFSWLTWKREVANDYNSFLKEAADLVTQSLERHLKQPQVYMRGEQKEKEIEIVKYSSNLDTAAWYKENEEKEDKLNKLDGLLSLKNATILIEI